MKTTRSLFFAATILVLGSTFLFGNLPHGRLYAQEEGEQTETRDIERQERDERGKDDSDKESSNRRRGHKQPVEEVEPGITIIGERNVFSEVTGSQSFLVKDEDNIVFTGQKLRQWSLEDNEIVREVQLEQNTNVYMARASQDGNLLLLSCYRWGQKQAIETFIRVIDSDDWEEVATVYTTEDAKEGNNHTSMGGLITSFEISPDNRMIAMFNQQQQLLIADIDTDEILLKKKMPGYVRGLAFLSKRELLISGNELKILDLETGKIKKSTQFDGMKHSQIVASSDHDLIAFTYQQVKLFSLSSGDEIKLDKPEGDRVNSFQALALSRDGRRIAGAGYEHVDGSYFSKIVVWDIESGRVAGKSGLSGYVQHLSFSHDGEEIFAMRSGTPGIIRIPITLDKDGAEEKLSFDAVSYSLAFGPEGKSFLTSTASNQCYIADIESGEIQNSFAGYSNGYGAMTVSEDGKKAAFSAQHAYPAKVIQIDMKSGKSKELFSYSFQQKFSLLGGIKSLLGNEKSEAVRFSQKSPQSIRYSKDGKELGVILFDQDKGIFFERRSSRTGKVKSKVLIQQAEENSQNLLSSYVGGQSSIKIAPDFSWLAMLSDSHLKIVDSETAEVISESEIQGGTLDISHDGSQIAVSSPKGVEVIDRESGEVLHTIDSSSNGSIKFAEDANVLVVYAQGGDAKVSVFDSESWDELLVHKTESKKNFSFDISPQGDRLIFGLNDCRYEVWDLNELIGN